MYKNLVTSPPLRYTPLILAPYLAALLLDPNILVTAALPLLAFAASFVFCGRRELHILVRRLAGVYLFTIPFLAATLVLHAVGVTPWYPAPSIVLVLIPLAYCGVHAAILFVVSAEVVVHAILGLFNALLTLIASVASTIVVELLVTPRGLKYARAALHAWADDDYSELERLIDERGVNARVKWSIIALRSGGELVGLVHTGVHYGPFRGACSSLLPHVLLERSRGILFALHGCGSHERNTTTRSWAERIIDAVLRGLRDLRECKPVKPKLYSVDGIDWYAVTIGCTQRAYVMVSSTKGVEDIPCEEVPPLPRLTLIDMHNREVPSVDTQGLPELLNHISHSLEECEKLFCCWRVLRIPSRIAKEARLCSDWVLILRLACGTEELGLAIFPANNVEPLAARMYAERLSGVHIVTIDDHSCAAAIDEGVAVLRWSDELARLIAEAYRGCELKPCSTALAEGEVDARLWGEEALREIRVVLRRGVRVASLPLIMYLVALAALLI